MDIQSHGLSFPKLSNAKPYSGQVRKDFEAIGHTVIDPIQCLHLFERNCDYSLSPRQRTRALQVITSVFKHPDPSMRRGARNIERAFAQDTALAPYAEALEDRGFAFVDKYTPRWSLIYGLLTIHPSQGPLCELGSTEKSEPEIISQLRSPKSSGHRTRMGAFLALVHNEQAPCYFLTLECVAGSLDNAGRSKEYYRQSAYRVGLRPTHAKFHRPYLGDERFYLPISPQEMEGWDTHGRHWPSVDTFHSAGVLL